LRKKNSFSCCFYPKQLTIAIYVRGRTPLEQLGVKCLAQAGTHWCLAVVSHTKSMCLIHCAITTFATIEAKVVEYVFPKLKCVQKINFTIKNTVVTF